MNYTIFLEQKAAIELQEAFVWYEDQKEGLGEELIEEVEKCYYKLMENPERFSYINPRYRRIKTNRFPYILVYEIEEEIIVINSVRHNKRKPI